MNDQYPIPNIQYPMTKPGFLQDNHLRFIFFCGKGGVGKTTSAAATALYLARHRPEERVLIVSTDPAHSLGDSFGQPTPRIGGQGAISKTGSFGGQVVPIESVDNPSTGLRAGLFALELDSERLLAEWRQDCNPMIARIADRGTYFDEDDINDFLQLTLPGMDEALVIMQIVALTEDRQYNRVVVDTAPTGHTLRLLALPDQMKLWIQVMDKLLEKHRFIVRSLVGDYRPDDVDNWLVKTYQEISHTVLLLQDARVTQFVAVTIPEEMAIYETRRLVSALKKHPLAVRNLVINQVVNHNGRCSICRQRKDDQASALAQIRAGFADLHPLIVPQLSHPVQGMEELARFGQFLAGVRTAEEDKETAPPFRGFGSTVLTRARAWLDFSRYWDLARRWLGSPPVRGGDGEHGRWGVKERPISPTPHSPITPSPRLPSSLLPPTARFILIGGKGGVGKTTTAAATALYLARRHPGQRILVFSTDPAHSVADSLDQPVGAQFTPIEPYDNLYAYETDAFQLLEDFKQEYTNRVGKGESATRLGQGTVSFREDMAGQMLDLIPPGLDELMALLKIMEMAEAEEFDVFILDTAPTGHLIRFLEMPEMAQNWLRAAARMLLKYKNTMRLGRMAELVIQYSRQVRTLRQQLVDSAQTEFIAITVPEAMAVAESERLLRRLNGLDIACRQMLINKVTQAHALTKGCPCCAARRRQEQRTIRQLMARHSDLHLAQAPQLPHHIRGIEGLIEFKEMLYRD